MSSKQKKEKLGIVGFLKTAFAIDLLKGFLTASGGLFKHATEASEDVSETLKKDTGLRRGYHPWPEALRRFNINKTELPEHLKRNRRLKTIYISVLIVSVFFIVDSIISEDTLLYTALKTIALFVFSAYILLEYMIASWRIRVFSQPNEAWPDFQTFVKESMKKLTFTEERGTDI